MANLLGVMTIAFVVTRTLTITLQTTTELGDADSDSDDGHGRGCCHGDADDEHMERVPKQTLETATMSLKSGVASPHLLDVRRPPAFCARWDRTPLWQLVWNTMQPPDAL